MPDFSEYTKVKKNNNVKMLCSGEANVIVEVNLLSEKWMDM